MKIDVKGAMAYFQNLKKNVDSEAEKAMVRCCSRVQEECVRGMTSTSTDPTTTYYKYNKALGHHPSIPYNYPAVDTGTLRRSITYTVETEEEKTTGRIGSTLNNPPYPVYLEYGTSRMQPRPWLKPSLDSAHDFIVKELTAVIRNAKK